MDPFSFAPIGALLDAAYALVEGIASLLAPFAGGSSAALAIVALTMLVRTVLIPVGISQVRAEWARRRIAPKLQALQRKYKGKPELLQQKTMALYKAENVSPFAGFLPALAQAPVISLVYALFIRTQIGDHPNALLGESLGGVTLGTSVFHAGWPGVLVFLALFAVMAVVAWMTRRTTLRLATEQSRALTLLSWLPFLTIPFAAVVPLAATIYLATTTLWTLVERALLRRRYWRSEEGGVLVAS
jgi:YidC/Oxa1 family membrane protein insertase